VKTRVGEEPDQEAEESLLAPLQLKRKRKLPQPLELVTKPLFSEKLGESSISLLSAGRRGRPKKVTNDVSKEVEEPEKKEEEEAKSEEVEETAEKEAKDEKDVEKETENHTEEKESKTPVDVKSSSE